LWFWPVGQGTDIAPPTLEEWLSFCEAVLGVQPPKADKKNARKRDSYAGWDDTLGLFGADKSFHQLAIEDDLDRSFSHCAAMKDIAADERFGWWSVLTDIADREGFFHWELEFAQTFVRGGFD